MKSAQGGYETAFREEERKWYQVLFSILTSRYTFWLCVFLLLFYYLQKHGAYHFFYIEQEQLFLYSKAYLSSVMTEPGGLARIITEYCVQFFIYPYFGALIMSVWFTWIGILTAGIIKRIAPSSNLFVLSLLPIVFLLYTHFDINYFYQGTIAYSMMLMVLWLYFRFVNIYVRILFVLIFSALLFWWAGAVAFLFVVSIFLWELFNRFSRAYGFILPLFLITGLSAWCIYTSSVGDYRFLLLPDGYFTYRLRPGVAIYFSWIFIPVLLILCSFLRRRDFVRGGQKFAESIIQLILVGGIFLYGMNQFVNKKSDLYKELDYYMRCEQWDQVIERCGGDLKNYLYKSCLNVALAEKGQLAERMFAFDQRGVESIYLSWNRVANVSVLLSDVYFSMGHIALSQRMAFEANVSFAWAGNPRMLKRLVQTNLIYGAYPVAEKYISLLEQTRNYKEWAQTQRLLLWNDEAVGNDPVLGIKQRCIPAMNRLSEVNGLDMDLRCIAEQNPLHSVSVEYAGAIYLLAKDMARFRDFVETYYGTDVLPVLPKSFQEAFIILAENDPASWEQFHISNATIRRYEEFKKQVLANKGNTGALPGLLKRSYGDTYWYYYMFKQAE